MTDGLNFSIMTGRENLPDGVKAEQQVFVLSGSQPARNYPMPIRQMARTQMNGVRALRRGRPLTPAANAVNNTGEWMDNSLTVPDGTLLFLRARVWRGTGRTASMIEAGVFLKARAGSALRKIILQRSPSRWQSVNEVSMVGCCDVLRVSEARGIATHGLPVAMVTACKSAQLPNVLAAKILQAEAVAAPRQEYDMVRTHDGSTQQVLREEDVRQLDLDA